MNITPISNRINCLKINNNNTKHESVSQTNVTLPSCIDAKSLVNINFKSIFEAIRDDNFEEFKQGIAQENSVNYVAYDKDTPLIRTSMKGQVNFVEELLKKPNIDINAQNRNRESALIAACKYPDSRGKTTRIAEKLLEYPDINVNLTDNEKKSALIYTSIRCNPDAVDMLVKHHDINVNQQDKDGRTALIWAAEKGYADVIEKLLQHPDIDVNLKDNDGNCALKLALDEKRFNCIKKILEHPDVDLSIRNKCGAGIPQNYSFDKDNCIELIRNYKKGIDKRQNVLSTEKNIQVDIDKLSPEENIWSEEQISQKFLNLVESGRLDDAETMINNTPYIDLTKNDNEILNSVCGTKNSDFARKVFEYEKNQPEMKADYEARRKEFLENTLPQLSYDELKENSIALNTADGFKVLMQKNEFNPNDKIGKRSLFEQACSLDSDRSIIKTIFSKYDDVDTTKVKQNAASDIKEMINEYETKGKYQLKLDKIKVDLYTPEKRADAMAQLTEYINSEEFKPEITDSLGNSAIHIVATMPDDTARGLIQKLVSKGVSLDAKNITNQNALISAIKAMRIAQNDEDKTKLLSNIKFLLDKGFDVNEPDFNGQTAFHHACSTTSVALLSIVLSKDPNILLRDKLGNRGKFYLSTPQMKETYEDYIK